MHCNWRFDVCKKFMPNLKLSTHTHMICSCNQQFKIQYGFAATSKVHPQRPVVEIHTYIPGPPSMLSGHHQKILHFQTLAFFPLVVRCMPDCDNTTLKSKRNSENPRGSDRSVILELKEYCNIPQFQLRSFMGFWAILISCFFALFWWCSYSGWFVICFLKIT